MILRFLSKVWLDDEAIKEIKESQHNKVDFRNTEFWSFAASKQRL